MIFSRYANVRDNEHNWDKALMMMISDIRDQLKSEYA